MIITDINLLRPVCTNAEPSEIESILDLLEKELKHSAVLGRAGLGLAAPQIGIPKNIAIVRIDNQKLNLVNCSIEKGYDAAIFEGEGCLSFPDKYVKTRRFQEIYVKNNGVEPFGFVATGLMAVCIQHELDHLNQILLPDLAKL